MTGVAGRRVLLGVSGGIACYKACHVARRLTEDGALVDVVMTASAGEFVRPLTFEALTGRPAVASLWERGRALDHVKLGRECDLIVVAPATAQLIARMAQGLADDFLTALLLARKAPVLLCPAMNDAMWARSETQRNVETVRRADGQTGSMHVLGPVTGPLAHGEGDGPGRMVEPEEICAWAERLLRSAEPFAGRHVVVTAGPTREPLDPVRVITNRSSGRMGYALAHAAWLRGADVTLIAGPSTLPAPTGVTLRRIETTEELKKAVSRALPSADALIMAAAPSDYHAGKPAAHKTKRASGPLTLTLKPTPDVLASTSRARKNGAVIVGFALETSDLVAAARHKLASKRLDLVVANSATEEGSGPESLTNRITLVSTKGTEALPLMPKEQAAEAILDRVCALLARG